MKLGPLVIGKDGGDSSTVDTIMFEIKSLFSIGILRFARGSRDAYHSHAFNCWSFVLWGRLFEEFLNTARHRRKWQTGDSVVTHRGDVHRVIANDTTYVLTIRGPWKPTWVDVQTLDTDSQIGGFGNGGWLVSLLGSGKRTLKNVTMFPTRAAAASYAERRALV